MIMFWGNLTDAENVCYRDLCIRSAPYLAWASLSKTKKSNSQFWGHIPTDEELFDMEMLAMKGWKMINELPSYRSRFLNE